MKIAALTVVYNECLILPYFLRHYEYLDEIRVLYETDSTDDTLNILDNTTNVIIKDIHMEGGLDDIQKANLINDQLHVIKADWVYVVDADEFIFPPYGSPHDFLSNLNYDVVRAAMFQVYRHRTDKDLDSSLPPVSQRIHGDPDVFSTSTKPNRDFNANYIKPIVLRPSKSVWFSPGNHIVEGNLRISPEFFMGVHWKMADPLLAVDRRMKNMARMSAKNKTYGMAWHDFNLTEEWLREECDRHLDDPIIEALCLANDCSPLEIAKLRNNLFIQEALIVELRSQIKDKESQIKDKESQIKNKESQIKNKESQIKDKESQIKDKENQIKDKENQIWDGENQIKVIENQIKDKENQLMKIKSSITWRFAKKLHNIIDNIFPPNNRIRLLATRVFIRS